MLALLAHAAPISYKFPLPIWLYVLAGGAAVLLSAPAAALAVRDEAVRERRGPDLYPLVRRLGPVAHGDRDAARRRGSGRRAVLDDRTVPGVLREPGRRAHVGRLLGRARHRLVARRQRLRARRAAQRRGPRARPRARRPGCPAARVPGVARPAARGRAAARVVVDGADLGPGEGAAHARAPARRLHDRDARRLRPLRRRDLARQRRALLRLRAHALALLAARAAAVRARGVGGRATSAPRGCAPTAPVSARIRRCRSAAARSS